MLLRGRFAVYGGAPECFFRAAGELLKRIIWGTKPCARIFLSGGSAWIAHFRRLNVVGTDVANMMAYEE